MTTSTHHDKLFSQRHRHAIILSLMLAAMAYLAVVIYTGHEQALQAITRLGVHGWLVVLAASMANYSLRYLRWQFYLKQAGWQLRHSLHFRYYLSAFALTTTPGKLGETIRSVLLRPHGVPYHTSLACFFTERFLDVVVVALIAMLLLAGFQEYAAFVVTIALALICLLPLVRSRSVLSKLKHWQYSFRTSRAGRFIGHMIHLLQHAHDFLAPAPLYIGLLLGLLAWSIQGLAFYYILQILGFEISLFTAMGIYAISLLAGAASFIPGGIGSTEVAMGLLLVAAGADSSTAISAPLISRLGTLWFAVAVGLLATGSISLRRKPHTVSDLQQGND